MVAGMAKRQREAERRDKWRPPQPKRPAAAAGSSGPGGGGGGSGSGPPRYAAGLNQIRGMGQFSAAMLPGNFVKARPHLFRDVGGCMGVCMSAVMGMDVACVEPGPKALPPGPPVNAWVWVCARSRGDLPGLTPGPGLTGGPGPTRRGLPPCRPYAPTPHPPTPRMCASLHAYWKATATTCCSP